VRALVLFALTLAGCTAWPEQAVRSGSGGVTVELPAGWNETPAGRVGNVVDPVARVVVASSPIEPADSPCQTSSYAFADDAVALVLVEWDERPDDSHPPRPERFTATALQILRGGHECYRGRSGSAFFADAGRTFGAYVFVGDDAPARLVEEVCAVLDSLAVTPA
jgi:hypothetical protein